ncbi:hypothetical protein [[Mycobacterium] wendilense]|uniref:Uncharacterized protein n=1 Tax=[Mycobacterium] wendilense TaxID=3064284 RepID=A0ABM9MEG8_9MYCO|nr:hypothetical protein [Mycolicibacterium sp. MU0050]CAJ1583259.1 hypothetical protein MU0050_002517 [Mycolicibacterium sp. MU0050]
MPTGLAPADTVAAVDIATVNVFDPHWSNWAYSLTKLPVTFAPGPRREG